MPGLLRQYALLSFPTGPYAHLQGSDLAENGLDGVECTAYHLGSGGVACIMSVTVLLLSIKDLAVATFNQSRAC